ncbi:SCO family protein [Azoarcus sp. DN11]|uniref:SCO family protein n=1 Tax=Azoarcus sp. DN11 TaxID=356837 RepID=UPI0013E3F5B9|nr:SCO family protein [Azoarcus sp. DN11]
MIKRLITAAAMCAAFSLSGAPGVAYSAPDDTWGADYFPNVPLVTQDGKTVRFYDDLLKGKKVLVNFIFSNCDQVCPLDTANMARVQKLLGEQVGRDVFMYSISLDPEHDTPEVLKAYAEKFGAGPGWVFLTGKRKDVDAVRLKLGDRGSKEEHANTVRIGDVAQGRWIRVPLTADPHYIMVEANSTLNPGWSTGKTLKSIADAPRPEVFGPGQLLFHNRCAACHAFGKGDRIGPDLQGVTARRARDWLVRYLAAPERMRADKDPIAMELASRYKVLMPDLSLTHKELGELIEYLEAKSVPQPAAATSMAPEAAGEAPPAAHSHDDHHHHDHVADGK